MSKIETWEKYLTYETLPNEDTKILADILGIEDAKKLICELSGITISIPINATLPARIDYIKEKYDGTKKSRIELAKQCEVSEGYIYRIARSRNHK